MNKLTLSLAIALCTPLPALAAGHSESGYPGQGSVPVFPEVFARPILSLDWQGEEVQTGWDVFYHNGLTVTDAEDSETREVTLPDGTPGQITVTFERTPNISCHGEDAAEPEYCADTATVVKVPPGYVAIPQSATVLEGENFTFKIIPELLG